MSHEPVFRLEGIVKTKDEMSDFEGPLALILQLLGKNRIEIRDISISLILEQYLGHLDIMSEQNLDIAGEFVAMASHLAYIKTKMLLSGDEEVSEMEQLIASLEELRRGDIYLQIKEAAQTLSSMYERGAALIAGPPEYLPKGDFEYSHLSRDLLDAMFRMLKREDSAIGILNPDELVYPEKIVYSIPEKISELLDMLKRGNDIELAEIFYSSKSRTELIAIVIAVLELCRVGSAYLSGFGDNAVIAYIGISRENEVPVYSEEGIDGIF